MRTGNESGALRFVRRSIDRGKYHKTYDEYPRLFDQAGLQVLEGGIAHVRGLFLTYTNYSWFKLKPREAGAS